MHTQELLANANRILKYEARESERTRSPDTPENFRAVWSEIAPKCVEAALPLRDPIPLPRTEQPRVGFYFPNAVYLAHAVNTRTLFNGLALGEAAIEPYVYVFGKEKTSFSEIFPGTRYCQQGTLIESMLEVRRQAIADQLAAMVFVSSPVGMAFASTMGVAPRHIWWAHKWHGLELPYLDGYLDACHPFNDYAEIDGRRWTCTYTALPEMFEPALTEMAQASRATAKAPVVFGSLVREAKLTEQYAHTVRQILDAVPGCLYVYAGREKQEWFEQILRPHDVQHVGWVHTGLWSQIIDIYLDTFPFQSGHTAFEAMAASRPVVWMHNPQYANEQGVTEIVAKFWHDVFPEDPIAHTAAKYIDTAVRWARDAELRKTYGAANRKFYDTFLRDERRMAESVSKAILAVINGA